MALGGTQKTIYSNRNRAAQSLLRKQQLIAATIECINRLGLSQTTLAKIASHAGVSQGIVIFHFQSKDNLLEQTLRSVSKEYIENWQSAITVAEDTPIDKLCAMVVAAFSKKVCTRKKVGVWYAFWGESRSRPIYHEVCGETDKAFTSTILTLCKALCVDKRATVSAEAGALSIEGLVDGLWQNCLIGQGTFNRKVSCNTIFELMELMFPAEKDAIQKHKIQM